MFHVKHFEIKRTSSRHPAVTAAAAVLHFPGWLGRSFKGLLLGLQVFNFFAGRFVFLPSGLHRLLSIAKGFFGFAQCRPCGPGGFDVFFRVLPRFDIALQSSPSSQPGRVFMLQVAPWAYALLVFRRELAKPFLQFQLCQKRTAHLFLVSRSHGDSRTQRGFVLSTTGLEGTGETSTVL